MKKHELIAYLKTEFDVEVVNVWHVKIKIPEGVHHIYFNNRMEIKLKLHGESETEFVAPEELFDKLRRYQYTKTELNALRKIDSLIKLNINGIYVDAGFKNGKAKIAVVKVDRDKHELSINIRRIECVNILQAETAAILWAEDLYPGTDNIYSDSENAVYSNISNRAKWISRKQNKAADIFANMRG